MNIAIHKSGVRLVKSGRRFWIEDGVVWQLIDRDGTIRGASRDLRTLAGRVRPADEVAGNA
jgi:hypothetical protein